MIAPPAVPPVGPLPFGAVVTLAANPGAGSGPAAAIDGAGVAAVLWSQTGLVPAAGQPALVNPYVAARENVAGDTWAPAQVVEAAAAGDAVTDRIVDLQAIGPGTDISAAWLRSPTSAANDRVRAARREAPNAWSFGNVAAGAGIARSELVFAANDAGVQAVAWIEQVGAGVPQVQLRVRRLGASGFDWTAPAGSVQSNAARVASNPALAMDPAGRVMIVWREELGTLNTPRGELRSRTYDATAGGFSPEQTVHSGLLDQRAPRVAAVAANRFVAVWEQLTGTVYDLQARAGNASNWEGLGSFTVDGRATSVSGARLVVGPNQTALVAWQQDDRLFASRWATGTWTLSAQIGAGLGGVASDLRMAADASGRAVVVWRQAGTSGVGDLYFALIPLLAPQDVTPPTLLEVASGDVSAPSVAMNASGSVVIAWRQAVSGQAQPDLFARVAR